MKMFDLLAAIITIMKSRISTIDPENIFDYEPGDGMVDVSNIPCIFVYDNQTDFQKSDISSIGDQSHEPAIYIDIYHGSKGIRNQGTGEVKFSIKKTHEEIRNIVSDVYQNILTWQPFRNELEKIIDETGGCYVARIEKLGVAKLADSSIALVAYRIEFRCQVEEETLGDDGITFDRVDNFVIPLNSIKGGELW